MTTFSAPHNRVHGTPRGTVKRCADCSTSARLAVATPTAGWRNVCDTHAAPWRKAGVPIYRLPR